MNFKQTQMLICLSLTFFPLQITLYTNFLFTDVHGMGIVKFEKVKVQESVAQKNEFYTAIYLHSGEV